MNGPGRASCVIDLTETHYDEKKLRVYLAVTKRVCL